MNELMKQSGIDAQMERLVKYQDVLTQTAAVIASSNMVPKGLQGSNPEQTLANVTIAIQFGMTLGFGPYQAVQNISAINGKPGVYGDAVTALIQKHPDLEYIKPRTYKMMPASEDISKSPDIPESCTVVFKRRSMKQEEEITVMMRDYWALYQDSSKKNTWGKYPKKMLYRKAMGELKEIFSDAFFGVRIYEDEAELPTQEQEIQGRYQDVPDAPMAMISAPPPSPTPASEDEEKEKAWKEWIRENKKYLNEGQRELIDDLPAKERNGFFKRAKKHIEDVKNIIGLAEMEDPENKGKVIAQMVEATGVGEVPAIKALLDDQ